MGCGILFPRDYRREWDEFEDAAAAAAIPCDDAVNGSADADAELGGADAGFSSSESEDERWWERPNPDNGTKVQVGLSREVHHRHHQYHHFCWCLLQEECTCITIVHVSSKNNDTKIKTSLENKRNTMLMSYNCFTVHS